MPAAAWTASSNGENELPSKSKLAGSIKALPPRGPAAAAHPASGTRFFSLLSHLIFMFVPGLIKLN